MKLISALCAVLGLALLISTGLVDADVPAVISYQGQLSDSGGTPLDGTYSITFSIYADNAGGSKLWTETQTVNVDNGLFTVLLGSGSPLNENVFASADRFLGISVDGEAELSPRHRFGAVGYSYRVGSIDLATGGELAGDLSVTGSIDVGGTISTPSGVTLESQGDTLRIVSGASQIIIRPDGMIEMQSSTVRLVSTGDLQLEASSDVNIVGNNINVNAAQALDMTAGTNANLIGSSVKVQATGTTDIDGSLVTIN